MANAFDHENTPFGAFGEFLPVAEADDTPEFWAEHDAEADAWFAEREAEARQFYWEAEADLINAQWDEPDFY